MEDEIVKVTKEQLIFVLNILSYVIVVAYAFYVSVQLSRTNDNSRKNEKISTQVSCRILRKVFLVLPIPFFPLFLARIPEGFIDFWMDQIPENMLFLVSVISLVGLIQVNSIWRRGYGITN
jgi:hypothetical protein